MTRSASPRRRLRPSWSRAAARSTDLVVVPDQSQELSGGVVVRAHVLARLLGIRLLRLDADVVLVPGALERLDVAPPQDPLPRPVVRPQVLASDDEARRHLVLAKGLLREADGALESARSVSAEPPTTS